MKRTTLPGLLSIVLLLLALAPAARAQRPTAGDGPGVVSGVVVGEAGRPLATVAVAVRSATDSSVVAGGVTGPDGRFRVAGLAPGSYRVVANLIGHSPYRSEVVTITAADPTVELGTVRLATAALAIQGVEVTGERSQVIVAPDRTIYSTRDMPVASGGQATDVLRSVPELEVDIEGAVSLRGTSAQIYLNGRPAPMQGEALQAFLQQFPADRIDRVEVIANPSARFEAEGAGGIVNIVLKKNADLGLSGSVFLNGSTRGDGGSGGRLAWQRGRVTLFGGGFFRLSNRHSTSYDLRQNLLTEPVTLLEQDGWSDREGWSGNVDVTGELKVGERSTLWTEARVWRNGSDSDGLTAYTESILDGGLLERYDRFNDDESVRLSTDLGAGFRHVFEPRRHELSFEAEYEAGTDDEASEIRRQILAASGQAGDLPVELTFDDRDEDERGITLKSDYVRPWGEEGQIEVGYQGRFDRNDNDRLRRIFTAEDDAAPDDVTRGGFSHQETFHSAYLTLARSFGALSAQAGLRAERADTRLELPDGAGEFDNDYASIFPNANLTWDLGEGRQVRASYSRRIRRPRPGVLNPINQSSDPLNRRVGNPYLDPQYTHAFSIEASRSADWGTLRVSPYFRRTENDWTQIKTVDTLGVSTVTWENLASTDSYGTSITASLRPTGGTSGSISVSGYREVRDASNLERDFSGSSMRWSARGNVSSRIGSSLSAQAMIYYTPARDVAQGRISSSLMTHMGLRKQFLGNRASLNLMVTDPFDLWRSSFETRDPTHVQIGRSRWSARSAVLSFSYSFGRPPRDARNQDGEQEAEEEQGIR